MAVKLFKAQTDPVYFINAHLYFINASYCKGLISANYFKEKKMTLSLHSKHIVLTYCLLRNDFPFPFDNANYK